ncbi:MAG: hypothetical protein ASARMPRED_006905 [Alectoria sarmentosa]|nr:MAG: hypothetical protein ASARMPRED_006905 [Alectoria sarmentosa]
MAFSLRIPKVGDTKGETIGMTDILNKLDGHPPSAASETLRLNSGSTLLEHISLVIYTAYEFEGFQDVLKGSIFSAPIVSGQTDRANLEDKRKARDLEEQIVVLNKRIERLTDPLIQVKQVVFELLLDIL